MLILSCLKSMMAISSFSSSSESPDAVSMSLGITTLIIFRGWRLSNQRWFYDSSLVSSALREVYDFSNLR
ncbi:unknown protein [Microcystis aeruginosa NIES-843]|uniref:Uncharacterized protein n=1 Tax=Microcystis aeruginosa (strain NIES-843 / IAM M-2473) TaxID=449447 RepID=B0JR00_MICAN|nr:unknown protein [Microcystis aeruginosa NIES-843]